MRLLLLAATAAIVPVCFGAPVTVVNPSFELPAVADGTYAAVTDVQPGFWEIGPGWLSNNASNKIGNPRSFMFATVPDGEQVAEIFAAGIFQVLPETITAGTTYELTVEVGTVFPGGNFVFPGYSIGLFAANDLSNVASSGQLTEGPPLASLTSNTLIPSGTFRTAMLSFTVPENHPDIGQTLGIALYSGCGDNEEVDDCGPGFEQSIYYDNVRLDATSASMPDPPSEAIPEPTSGLLVISAIGALAFLRSRKS